MPAASWSGRSALALMAAIATAPAITAQTGSEPRLVFTVFGGVLHHGHLWSIDRQPLTSAVSTLLIDTLGLQRRVTTGPTAGVTASLFRSSRWGIQVEAAYLGIRLDDTCRIEFANPDGQNRAIQLCNDVTQQVRVASTTSFTIGGVRRFFSRAPASPYFRIAAGLAVRSSSVISMWGRYTNVEGELVSTPSRQVIDDRRGPWVAPTAGAGAGIVIAMSPGYRVRLEVRDYLVFLDRPLGPADRLLTVQTESTPRHFPTFIMGLDIVLGQRRGRRY
jgi:hypothetical protein